ncbi:MAG: hypothetical protein KJO92_13125, partial [Gammaproteobacteria bacterium]|nr:hypothetical protein [Gammaproteobacteria bacterium]
MELKETLLKLPNLSTRKHVDRRLIYFLGLFGILIIVFALWLSLRDWREADAVVAAEAERRSAVDGLMQPIQALKRVMADDQVQALALRALENPETKEDLSSYISGRINQVSAVHVFSKNVSEFRPADFGPNGFAVLEMILSTLEISNGLMQIHHVVQPPRLYDSALITSGGEAAGVLVVEADPVYLLAGYNPVHSSIGFVRLTQYNGRQPLSNIREWGNASLLGEYPDRVPVPGTLFRIEFPQQSNVALIGKWTALLMILSGLLCLAVTLVLLRSNRLWQVADAIEKAKMHSVVATSPDALEAGDDQPEAAFTAEPPLQDREDGRPEVDSQTGDSSGSKPEKVIPEPPPMRLHYDINERRKLREAEHSPVELSSGIFRAYDIRGVIDKTLDSGVARSVGQAVGTVALEQNAGPVVVARDGRLSGPYLMEGMIEGIVSTGCDVLDIGAVPTGVLYFAAHEMASGSGVMITGSHNPPDYNGFKIMVAGNTLHGESISNLYERIRSDDLKAGEGSVTQKDVVPEYIDRIAGDIQVERDLKVVIDCGNGIGGVCAADTLRALGVEVLPLFDEVDGTFPNHHP